MAGNSFFEERQDQSAIKAQIVEKYFLAWAKVIGPSVKKRNQNLAYVDLYAGPGRYRDGAASTPLLVLERAISHPDVAERLVTVFNDLDANLSATLQSEINDLEGIEKLKNAPIVLNENIEDVYKDYLSDISLVPTFSFFDPFGYVGLSLRIIQSFIKDWGCDTVFFFNYNRINAGIGNPAVAKHMNELFGDARAEQLRKALKGLQPDQRELLILEELANALKEMGGNFILPFRFRNEKGTRTSHCLVFVSKHKKGYEIMKEIMARESSVLDQGVPSFTYSPADESTPLLFSLAQPLSELSNQLLERFAGMSLSMREIYECHHVDTPFILRNFKDVLRELEEDGKIVADPPAEKRRKNRGLVTFADHVQVTFPAS